MNPADLPLACELFAQWQDARGGRTEPASRPFSRDWEELLEEARLLSAAERGEAERDARALAEDGWLELRTVPRRPHLILRLLIPLAAEPRWRAAFGFAPPSDPEARQIREHPWGPELAFLAATRVNLPFAELLRLDEFLKRGRPHGEIVPIKERSLEIFGDEKRLDLLADSVLFRDGRLDLRRHLGCEIIGVPLAWKRGPAKADGRPVLAIENAATWHSYCRWNAARGGFSAVVYGDGKRFLDGVPHLPELFAELGGSRPILYFGDLDPAGVVIPREASARARVLGLPVIDPHLWSYRRLLERGAGETGGEDPGPLEPGLCDWLGPCAEPARRLFTAGHRLAQEHIGWDFLRDIEAME